MRLVDKILPSIWKIHHNNRCRILSTNCTVSISDRSNLIVGFNSFELHKHHHGSSQILPMALPTTMPFASKMIWYSVFSCILGVSGDMLLLKHAFFIATHLLHIYTNHLWYI